MVTKKLFITILIVISGFDIGLLLSNDFSIADKVAPTVQKIPSNTDKLHELPLDQIQTEQIRPVDASQDQIIASGAVELVDRHEVLSPIEALVSQVSVNVGDTVSAGAVLVNFDTTSLSNDLQRARLDVDLAQSEYNKLYQKDPNAIDAARKSLIAAQANYSRVQAGASSAELAAAQQKVNSASNKLSGLQAQKNGAAVSAALARMEKADIDRKEALRAYDKVKWRNDVGMTPEAAALHRATVAYEEALAEYQRVTAPASAAELSEAQANIQSVQSELAALQSKPSSADLADAAAKIAEAEQRLAEREADPAAVSVQSAQTKIEKAKLAVLEIEAKLRQAQIVAPMDGTILSIAAKSGKRSSTGEAVVTIANLNELKLMAQVAEVDIPHVEVGQQVSVTVDALDEQVFEGIVEQISPVNKADRDIVSYPVTIKLTDSNLEDIRPGMSAQAALTLVDSVTNRWMVPTNSLQSHEGHSFVLVLRDEKFAEIQVTQGQSKADWTIVHSDSLVAEDIVMGQIESKLHEQDALFQ